MIPSLLERAIHAYQDRSTAVSGVGSGVEVISDAQHRLLLSGFDVDSEELSVLQRTLLAETWDQSGGRGDVTPQVIGTFGSATFFTAFMLGLFAGRMSATPEIAEGE